MSQAEMPRAPFKIKGEGSEEAGQGGLLWVLLGKKKKTVSKRGDPEGEVARHSLFPSVVPIPARIQRPISLPKFFQKPRVSRHELCSLWWVGSLTLYPRLA